MQKGTGVGRWEQSAALRVRAHNSHMGWLTCVANRSSLTSSSEFLSAPSSVFADGGVQVRSLLRSHSQGERSRASLAPGLYHPSPSIFSPSWSDRQGAVDDGAITGLRMRRSSAVRRPTPCHFSSLSSLLVHSSLFFWPSPPTVKFAGRSLLVARPRPQSTGVKVSL